MRTHLEFRSDSLVDADGGRGGRKIVALLAEGLPRQGFAVDAVVHEDWGWVVRLVHAPFPLWIGCGPYQEQVDGHLCFIEPSTPVVRRWLRNIPTAGAVERLATAMEAVLRESGLADDLRWWTDAEVRGDV